MQSAAELEVRTETRETRGERRKQKLYRAKMETKKDDEEKFSEILDCCRRLVSTAIDDGNDILEMLDPLISDTQCHLHSVLILNVLHKCYNIDELRYYGIDKLNGRDMEILSYAVLFSLLKIEYRDKFGFILHQVSLNHFYGSLLSSRNKETYYIAEAKKIFNSYSVEYIKSVASEKIKGILNDCAAASSMSQLSFLPCYASTYAVIDFIEGRKLPIILSLVVVNAQGINEPTKYNMSHKEVRFYEFQGNENKFIYKKELSENDKKIPTITFSCYIITTDNTDGFQVDGDVRDFLMLSAAGHIQLPKNAKLPVGYEEGEEYARSIYEKNVEVLIDYNKHYELAKKRNLIDAQYSKIVRSSVEQGDGHTSFTIERRREETSLLDDHIYLSNYSREYQRLKRIDFHGKLDQHEVFEFNKKKETLEALKRFTVYQNVISRV